MLKRYIGTFHVSTPDSVIEHDIRDRASANAHEEYNGPYADRMVEQALAYHHANQAEYCWIMGDHS